MTNSTGTHSYKIKKIISGGQTGADRAGLNTAMNLGIEHGGYAPRNRIAEDEQIPSYYNLKEHWQTGYFPRTLQNILDSDGTIVFTCGAPTSGSALTLKLARRNKIPWLWVNLQDNPEDLILGIAQWLEAEKIQTLNVAGSRQSILQLANTSGHLIRLILGKALLLQSTLK